MAARRVRVDFKGSKGHLVAVNLTVDSADSPVAIQATARRKLSAETRKAVNLNCTRIEIVDLEMGA